MVEKRQPLNDIYPAELSKAFPTLETEIADFLSRNSNKIATLETPPETITQWAQELQSIATTVAKGINQWPNDITQLYLNVTQPSREKGPYDPSSTNQVGLILGKHRYHVLERNKLTDKAVGTNILFLLQRLPFNKDTGAEVHGVRKIKPHDSPALKTKAKNRLVSDEIGGIEIYLPLTDEIEFNVNNDQFTPKALKGLVTILPGDTHHHIKSKGRGPARVLIIGGFGFSRAPKTDADFKVKGFDSIPRYTSFK